MTETISRILILCPEKGSPVETVMRMRPSAFEALHGEYSFRCSLCGKPHTWRKEDAWLEPARRTAT
ncbi:MAG: hypothetical protein ACREEW_03965 [Caulobacteraceae bacterium]